MGEIKGIDLTCDMTTWGLGFCFFFDKEFPTFLVANIGPFILEINQWQYWKKYFK